MSYRHHELRCTLQRVETKTCQRSPGDTEKYGALTQEQMAMNGARVRGLPALVRSIRGKNRIEFLYRDFNAALDIRRCAMLESRSPGLTRTNFKEQPRRAKLHKENLNPVVGGQSRKTEKRLYVGVYTSTLSSSCTQTRRWILRGQTRENTCYRINFTHRIACVARTLRSYVMFFIFRTAIFKA
jgi:hypothetical protein